MRDNQVSCDGVERSLPPVGTKGPRRSFGKAGRMRPIGPTGKSLLIYRNRVKYKIKRNQKYFAFPEGQIRGISIAIPSRSEGRIMIATNVGRVAVDAGSADSERLRERTAKTCGPDARYAGVKFRGNKLLGNDGGKRASAHRGERVISRKAIAQGMSDCLRCPVCSCAQPTTLAHGTSGAACIRHSLRPLIFMGRRIPA